jgi:hypothetical protein
MEKYPLLKTIAPYVAGADVAIRTIPGLLGAGAGAIAGAAESSATVAGLIPGGPEGRFGQFDRPLTRTEADILQRDIPIIGQVL